MKTFSSRNRRHNEALTPGNADKGAAAGFRYLPVNQWRAGGWSIALQARIPVNL